MINANELRIGNYALYFGKLWIVEPKDLFELDLSKAEPIPLTPEILVKAGFVKGKAESYFRIWPYYNGKLTLHIHEEYGEIELIQQGIVIVELKTVHQLQNLYFALTGEELDIKM